MKNFGFSILDFGLFGTQLLFAVVFVLLLSGCYSMFAAKTKAEATLPDGRVVKYESEKEQQGIDVKYTTDEKGQLKELRIKVDKAGGQEAAIEAMVQLQASLARMMERLLPLLDKAAMAAGS